MCGEGTRPGGRGLRPPPPGAVWHSACWCRGFLVEFCCPGRTDSQGLGLWGRQALLLTDGCAVRGCGAPALGSAQPGSALLCPHFGSPATPAPPPPSPPRTPPTAQRSRAALGHPPQSEQRGGAGRGDEGWGCGEAVGPGGRAEGAGRGRAGGCARGSAWPRGRAWPGCASLRARVRGLHTRP